MDLASWFTIAPVDLAATDASKNKKPGGRDDRT